MSTSQRRRWRPEEKLRILEEARQTDQTVSAVCRHYQIAPGQFYAWEKQARQYLNYRHYVYPAAAPNNLNGDYTTAWFGIDLAQFNGKRLS